MFIRMMLVVGVGLYTSRVVLRVLGVEDFGTYNLVGTIVVMFSFLKQALTNATYRFLAFDLGAGIKENLQRTFSMSINVHLLLMLVIVLLSEIVGPWYIGSKMQISPDRVHAAQCVFQFSLLTFAIGTIKTPFNSLIVAHERMDFYALTSIIEVLMKLGVVYLLVIFPFDKLILYGFLLTCVSVILFVWMVLYCRRNFEECRYTKVWDKGLLKKLVNYSGLSLVVNMVDVAVGQSIGIFFNQFYGLVANAGYGIATNVNSHLNQFVSSFSQSYNPQIIKSYAAGQYEYFHKLINTASKISFLLYFSVAFPILFNIDYILEIWLVDPPKFSAEFLYCIAIHSIFDALGAPMWNSVHATGDIKVHQWMMAAIKIMNIPISYLLLSNGYPVISVLIVYALLNIICWFVRTLYLRKLIDFNAGFYFKDVVLKLIFVVVISVTLTVICSGRISNPLMKLIVSTLFFEVVYLPLLYFLALNVSERSLVNKLVQGVINKIKNQ